jgi:molecular chaperone HscC
MHRIVSVIIGIDLGTTYSAAGICEGGNVRLFPNPLDAVLTPAVVATAEKTGTLVVGRTAKDLVTRDPARGAARFKIDMGTPRTRGVGARSMTAVELSGHVLDALRSDAERALGTQVVRAVITVPAYFDDAQRHATRQAAELAGLHVERLLNEPTAAAIAYGHHRRDHESLFAIVDLGGGTFDVCVMEQFEGILQVKGVAGDGRLGGEDFTATLAELLATRAGLDRPAEGTPAWALLYKRAETAKRALSRWEVTEVTLPSGVTDTDEVTLRIAREDVEAAWAPLLDRMRGPLRTALRGAGVERDRLAEVVLVGGATRMPCVQRMVTELLGRKPVHHADPDLLVAEGAAIQAAMLSRDAAVSDLVVTDVASHSLGVSTSKTIAGQIAPGYFSPIIHRNTVIPASRSEEYVTISPGQNAIVFGIYEGEARMVADNRKIGEISVPVPAGPPGKVVRVRFTYDQDGMLEIEALVLETGRVSSAIFHREGREVTGPALEEARARLRALRADPMDRPRYRDVHARAKLQWQEGNERERVVLGFLIDEFDAAIAGRNPVEIEHSYRVLLARCEAADGGERW